jgi:hypothetical protein
MKPIQEFSDDDIVEELMTRYDDVVVAGRKVLTVGGKTERRRWWKGDLDACIGLVQSVSANLIKCIWEERKSDED